MCDFESTNLYKTLKENSVVDVDNPVYKFLEQYPEIDQDMINIIFETVPNKLLHLDNNSIKELIQLCQKEDIVIIFSVLYDDSCEEGYQVLINICDNCEDRVDKIDVYAYRISPSLFNKLTLQLTSALIEFTIETRKFFPLQFLQDFFGFNGKE